MCFPLSERLILIPTLSRFLRDGCGLWHDTKCIPVGQNVWNMSKDTFTVAWDVFPRQTSPGDCQEIKWVFEWVGGADGEMS